jgi:hypothetical protein
MTEADKMIAKTITNDCFACPASWSGVLTDDRRWRARYRWGVLRFTVDADQNRMSIFSKDAPEVEEEFELGGEYDGVIEFDEVRETLAEHIDFNQAEWVQE